MGNEAGVRLPFPGKSHETFWEGIKYYAGKSPISGALKIQVSRGSASFGILNKSTYALFYLQESNIKLINKSSIISVTYSSISNWAGYITNLILCFNMKSGH